MRTLRAKLKLLCCQVGRRRDLEHGFGQGVDRRAAGQRAGVFAPTATCVFIMKTERRCRADTWLGSVCACDATTDCWINAMDGQPFF